MYRTEFWTLWEKARVGCFERTASKHVYYLGWNRSPAQAGYMRQVLRADALRWPRGIGWRGRWEGGSGWGTHVNPWLIHVSLWQNPLQYCKVISLQLIKINGKKKSSLKRALSVSFRSWSLSFITFAFNWFLPSWIWGCLIAWVEDIRAARMTRNSSHQTTFQNIVLSHESFKRHEKIQSVLTNIMIQENTSFVLETTDYIFKSWSLSF